MLQNLENKGFAALFGQKCKEFLASRSRAGLEECKILHQQKHWKLVFRGCATIEPAEGRVVPVLIWEISDRDERNLDRYEGYPSYYFKRDMTVTMTDLDGRNPQEVTAMVYLMTDGHPLQSPWRGYLDTLAEGYRRFGFNPCQLELAVKEAKEGSR